jgi:hypothetical protein
MKGEGLPFDPHYSEENMKRLVVLAVLLLSVGGFAHAQETANWTILHYAAVDNNLEGAMFNDLYEMQTIGSGDGVNIVAQLDRAEGFENRFGDWTDTRRFYIEPFPPLPELDVNGKRAALVDYFVAAGYGDAESLSAEVAGLDDALVSSIYENNNVGVSFDQTPIEELGEIDMGDPQALVDFLVWGAQNFPAEHYLVIIGSHGGGWRGIGPDEGNDESMLDLPEIDAALGEARTQLGIEKFDIVGFDACLMAVTDVAVTLEPHADYILFSQEVIPSNGWEYAQSITDMAANPDWDAFQVGAAFIDNYMDYYAGQGGRTKLGLSLVETAGLPALLGSLENFAQVVEADTVELLSALGSARNNSQLFGTSLGDRADTYSYVDLRDFMNWFSLQTTITEDSYNAALEVLAAYDSAVVYSRADSKLPRANGMGVYLPSTPIYYEAYGATYPQLAPPNFAFWQDYLNQFYTTIASELDGSALQLTIKDVFTLGESGSSVDTPVIFFDAGGKGVVELAYTITYVGDDGTRTIVDTSPISYTSLLPTGETLIEYPNELTPSTFTWSVEFPYLTDGTNKVLSLLQASSSSSDGTIQGTYVNAEGAQPAYLIFDTDTYTYSGILAVAEDAPYEVNPLPGDQFIVDLISITTEGEVTVQPLVDTPLTFGVEPFTFTYSPAISGEYEVGLSMTDLAGNRLYEKVAVTVNNDAVDGTLRGYTDTNEGVYFQYPYAWGEFYQITNEDGSITSAVSDDAGIQSIFIDAYLETDALTALENVLSTIDAEVSEITETTLGGLPAYTATYSFESDEGTTFATVASVLNEEAASVIVFTLQSSGDDPAADEAVAALLDSTLGFFAPILEEA